MKTKIFVVEDDPHIRLGLEDVLQAEGYAVASCGRGDEALGKIQAQAPDLLILDVMLPGMNGFEICRSLRQQNSSLPILMLTAKGQEMDKVTGLQLGADDYVTKPFGIRELIARAQALLRRSGAVHQQTAASPDSFLIGENVINFKTFEVTRRNVKDTLTARELKLLTLLHKSRGEVFSRDRLLSEVWGYNYFGTTRTLDQVIAQLRKKLGDAGAEPKLILTVHGVGYKLSADPPDK
jgi:DNA-binding response OmpR family regulator